MADRKDDWQDVAKGLQAKAAPRERSVDSVVLDAAQEIVRLRALVEDLSLLIFLLEGEQLRELHTAIDDVASAVSHESFLAARTRLAAALSRSPSPVAGGPGGAEEGAGPT